MQEGFDQTKVGAPSAFDVNPLLLFLSLGFLETKDDGLRRIWVSCGERFRVMMVWVSTRMGFRILVRLEVWRKGPVDVGGY